MDGGWLTVAGCSVVWVSEVAPGTLVLSPMRFAKPFKILSISDSFLNRGERPGAAPAWDFAGPASTHGSHNSSDRPIGINE